MSNETDIDRCVIGATIDVEVAQKVLKKYKLSADESNSLAYARALEDSVRDVQLSPEDYTRIAQIVADNKTRRLERRQARKAKGE